MLVPSIKAVSNMIKMQLIYEMIIFYLNFTVITVIFQRPIMFLMAHQLLGGL